MDIAYFSLIGMMAAFVLGLSKSGIKGITMIIVTILAILHGAKASTGVLLPLLICGDIIAVLYYKKHVDWKYVYAMLPWVLIGVVVGSFIGKDMPETLFTRVMALIILFTVFLMAYMDLKKIKTVPTHWSFAGFMGLMAGITTMIGNLAGAFTNIYFIAMRLPKNAFIGTAAYLFFIVNLFKLPFHIFLWKTVNVDSILISLYMMPATIIGFFIGVRIVKLITDQWYRKLILVLTAVGAVIMFLR